VSFPQALAPTIGRQLARITPQRSRPPLAAASSPPSTDRRRPHLRVVGSRP
jgi:hypothetical protein